MSGYLDASIYVILSAIVFVFLDKLCNNIDPITALFAMSGIAIVCFNLLSIKDLKKTYTACFDHKLLFLLMSLALGADWVCLTFGTHLSDPFITMAALFITLAFFGFAKLYIKSHARSNLISMALLLISVLILYQTYEIKISRHVIYGLILGAIAGMAFFAYIVLSDILSKRGQLSTLQLLATRFWMLFLGSAFFMPWSDVFHMIQSNAIPLILVSFGSLIIPIFFNQQAIKKLGPARSSIIISFVPPVTYLFESWYESRLILTNFLVCVIISMALILPKLFVLSRR